MAIQWVTNQYGRVEGLTPEYVRALPTWKPVARTAVLPDGPKVREMYDSTTGETWYVNTTPSEKKKKSARQLDAEIVDILTTPEEDFGTRKRGGGTGEPA
jgi:hypothetical protein